MQDGQRDEMKLEFDGKYFQKGSHHYVIYEEKVPDSSEMIKNRLKFADGFMKVTKKGSFSSEMYFEPGGTHQTEYCTPFGKIPLSMRTNEFYVKKEEKDGFALGVNYVMIAGHSHLVDCQMQIGIRIL